DEDELGRVRNVRQVGEELAVAVRVGAAPAALGRLAIRLGACSTGPEEPSDDDQTVIAEKGQGLDRAPQLGERKSRAVERREVEALDVGRPELGAQLGESLRADEIVAKEIEHGYRPLALNVNSSPAAAVNGRSRLGAA